MKKTQTKQPEPAPAKPITPTPAKAAFNAKNYVKGHVTLSDVEFAKQAFDLFDIDQSGYIDCNGITVPIQS